ncbi:multi-component transcriptional regulator [Aphanothece hegewaldii CCALA 016]|uniref:Multi-component transcriptional regulator n=1 Tax=Aphanothece hegewaldii CCALA 016 TaxID=2107694 RepID=A0A2T1LW40_9CHRO|nr:response regulator [Aphanothece hegewaldii]PSF36119.1 multi-component transcriptional regulator [Aphanothece hegewaldii CCALA 016]
MRILLIEDDIVLADVLVQSLTRLRYLVDAVEDGQLGWDYIQSASYDLILMDVGLPKLDGISLCERLRHQGYSTPILLMTAKDEQRDRIRGLDAGADDYLIKPVNIEELQARLRALLRRGEVLHSTIIEICQLSLDPKSCEVTYDHKPLSLTPKEYSLLELFMRNPERVFSRGQLIEQLWSFEDTPQEDSVKAHIKGLRQKLKAAGAVDWIENVYGLGYRFNPKIETQSSVEQEFRETQERLWKQYASLTQQRLDILHNAASSLVKKQLTIEEQTSARQAAHKLAGVLGMFEREYGSVLAKQMEKILESSDITSQTQDICRLIQELSDYLNLTTEQPKETELETVSSYFLLVDTDTSLKDALQTLASSVGGKWKQVTNLAQAQTWLQQNTCDGVILNLEQNQTDLKLLSELAQRTPPIPVLVLITSESIIDRVAIAQAGGKGILTLPVTPEKIWQIFSQLLQRYRSQNTRVLVVDDDPILLASLRPLLEPWGIRMTGLSNPLKCWETLESIQPDLLILDIEMPQLNGIELCRVIRTNPIWQDLPILFLSVHQEIDTIQDIFRVGGDDYILKPVVAAEFLTRITQRLERNRLLKTLSYRDAVTGLTNQVRSHQELELILEQAKEHQQPFTFVLLKLTQLSQINQVYGHHFGNQILQAHGTLIQSTFPIEEVGYWNNGEFAIVFPHSHKTEAQQRIEELLTRIRKQVFITPSQEKLQAFCDWAIVEYPRDGTTIQSLYQAAIVIIDQKNR